MVTEDTMKDRKGRKAIEHTKQRLERLTIEYVPVGSIKPNAYNPNRQSEQEHEMLLRSIQDNGFTQPVIVNTEGVIIDGEHRWQEPPRPRGGPVGFPWLPPLEGGVWRNRWA